MSTELVDRSFYSQAVSFPARVDAILAEVQTIVGRKELLDKAAVMQQYAKRIKAGIDIEKPIAIGTLKLKAGLGELMPAKPPSVTGAMKGKKGSESDSLPFSNHTIAAYRKLAKNRARIDEFAASIDDVPTQDGFIRFCKGAHVSKNSGENEWYTPPEIIERARRTMGGIDLDPASCEFAQQNVQAKRFYTLEEDGLGEKKRWGGRVWMNPPYSRDLCRRFAEKLLLHWQCEHIAQACVLVNNATETSWMQLLLRQCTAVCFPAGRIQFLNREGKSANSPLQGQTMIYFGSEVAAFAQEFGDLGAVLERTYS